MNFKRDNAKHLIDVHIKKAEERLVSARTLLDIGNFEDSISRSYYAILDSATACLIKKDIVPHSHAGAIKLFSLHYIKPDIVEQKYQRQFAKIEKARIEADYTHLRTFTREEAAEILGEANQFFNSRVFDCAWHRSGDPHPFLEVSFSLSEQGYLSSGAVLEHPVVPSPREPGASPFPAAVLIQERGLPEPLLFVRLWPLSPE